jgi:uncharacterized protein YecT (DUF1311 family)
MNINNSNTKLFLTLILSNSPSIIALAQSEATTQAEIDYKKSNTELNSLYNKVIKKLPDTLSRTKLVNTQKAWIIFRDLDAKFRAEISSNGGSAYSMDFISNLTDLTNQRITQLNSIFNAL